MLFFVHRLPPTAKASKQGERVAKTGGKTSDIELHEHGAVVGDHALDHGRTNVVALRGKEHEIDGTLRPRRRKCILADRVTHVIAEVMQMTQEGGRGITRLVACVKIAADNRRYRPTRPMVRVLVAQPIGKQIELMQTLHARTVMEVQIDDRDNASLDINLGAEKPFLPYPPAPENNRMRFNNGHARKRRVSIAQVKQAVPVGVHSKRRMRHVRMFTKIGAMIKVTCPPGVLVDLLQGHHIRMHMGDQMSYLEKIAFDAAGAREPLDGIQTTSMGDIKSHEPDTS